jgi:hypothetical protein
MLENSLSTGQALSEVFVNPLLDRALELFPLPLLKWIDQARRRVLAEVRG